MKKIVRCCVLCVAWTLLILVTAVVGIVWWDLPPRSVREYVSLKTEWDQFRAGPKATDAEKRAAREEFAHRSLKIAEANPNSAVQLCALMLADEKGRDTDSAQKSRELLLSQIAIADLNKLSRALMGYGGQTRSSPEVAVPAILSRMKQNLDHPAAPYILSQIGNSIGWNSESNDPPAHFAEIADLIADRYAESPEIYNFCNALGNGLCSPRWAPQFEKHVRRILEVNTHRWVRCTALMALGHIAQAFEDRHPEAEETFASILQEFDGTVKDRWQNVIQTYRYHAQLQIEAMQFAAIGKPAPEIAGLDLDARPMSLSEYRGKVVLLTFWATWCYPCMKLVPHEKSLAEKYAGQPFAIIGVNADDDHAKAVRIGSEKGVTWRSFRDKQEAGKVISNDWKALFPTVYLIDHKGIVRHRYSGSPNPDLIQQSIEKLLTTAGE